MVNHKNNKGSKKPKSAEDLDDRDLYAIIHGFAEPEPQHEDWKPPSGSVPLSGDGVDSRLLPEKLAAKTLGTGKLGKLGKQGNQTLLVQLPLVSKRGLVTDWGLFLGSSSTTPGSSVPPGSSVGENGGTDTPGSSAEQDQAGVQALGGDCGGDGKGGGKVKYTDKFEYDDKAMDSNDFKDYDKLKDDKFKENNDIRPMDNRVPLTIEGMNKVLGDQAKARATSWAMVARNGTNVAANTSTCSPAGLPAVSNKHPKPLQTPQGQVTKTLATPRSEQKTAIQPTDRRGKQQTGLAAQMAAIDSIPAPPVKVMAPHLRRRMASGQVASSGSPQQEQQPQVQVRPIQGPLEEASQPASATTSATASTTTTTTDAQDRETAASDPAPPMRNKQDAVDILRGRLHRKSGD